MRLSYDKFLQTFPSAPGRTARYGVAVVSSVGVLLVCLLLEGALGGRPPHALFMIPVMVSAWFGGLGPGLLAALLSGLASDYFLTKPHFPFFNFDMADRERLTLFLTISGLLAWLIETTRVARQRVWAGARGAEQRQIELEERIVERWRAREERERLITERERLIAELETERARLKAVVEHIGQGKIGLQKAPVDLAEVVATAVETSRPLIESHRHNLTVSLPDHPIRIEADTARLAQALSNLLNNAAKYTEDGGRIELIAERVSEVAVLRVRDNWVGIAPEALPQVFDMFMQVESSTDRSQGGLGIGLMLVRRLVEMHGGKIEARSAGLGKGSEFLVRLPTLAEPAPESAPELPEASPTSSAKGSRRMLVVDDNVDSAESMALVLRLQGHEVRLAYDGQSALEEAQSFRPEVMFLDLDLPKMDGYEVARRLRLEPAMRDMTLVAMTGYGQEEDRQRTQEAGFQLHLVKPVDFNKVEVLLSSAL